MTDIPEPEKIGYGRPPKQYQFKKGKSGNPGGRPKGLKSTDDIVIQILQQQVPARINGKLFTTSAHKALLMAQIKKGMDGDTKAAKFLLDALHKAEERKYYMEKAVHLMHKQMTIGMQKAASDPKAAQAAYNAAREIAEAALRRSKDEGGN